VAAVGPTIRIEPPQLRERALAIEAGSGLPARRWLRGLRRHAGPGGDRLRPQEGLSL